MTDSRRIAGLLGPTLIALAASEALNPHIWVNVPTAQTYLAGALWFVMLGGLFRMFSPEFAQHNVPNSSVLLAMQMVLLTIGGFLTFKAFGRGTGTAAAHSA